MIYPKEIPENTQRTEKLVYEQLSKLPDDTYTVYYNQEFTSDSLSKEKTQYEIDFIIAYHPEKIFKALLVLEVKGGSIEYNAVEGYWKQAGKKMKKSPVQQATSNMHSLLKRYYNLLRDVNLSWGVCFPEILVPENSLPNNLSRKYVLDANDVKYALEESLESLFQDSIQQLKRSGANYSDFLKLEEELLKSCNFVKPLSLEIKENNQKFLKLTQQQAKIVRFLKHNDNFCIQGPAGSGKTLIAYQQAIEYKQQGLNVLYVTFNKQIATHLRRLYRKEKSINDSEGDIDFVNFHYWAQRIAEENPSFKKEKSSAEYFNTYIPNKALEVIKSKEPIYDVLIVDEGQDFRENWLTLLNKVLKKDGKFLIFMDENQDIFNNFSGVPHHRNIVNLNLEENCRNTVKIVNFLNDVLKDSSMVPMEGAPEGSDVVLKMHNNNEEQINCVNKIIEDLIGTHKVKPSDIMILTNNVDRISSLRGIKELGGVSLKSTYDRSFGRAKDTIFYTTINTFKGLEAEVVIILDGQNMSTNNKSFYTQASRAKNKLFINFLK